MPLDKTNDTSTPGKPEPDALKQASENAHLHHDAQKSALDMIVDWVDPLDQIAKWRYESLENDIDAKLHGQAKLSTQERTQLKKELADGGKQCSDLIQFHDDANHLIKEGVKSVGLFMRGTPALGLSVLAYGLDEWKPGTDQKTQTTDVLCGVAKGAALKMAFGKIGQLETEAHLVPGLYPWMYKFLGLRVFGMGITSRALDTALTRTTWVNENTHEPDIPQGADRIKQAVFSPMLLSDLAAATVASGLHLGVNKMSGESLLTRPLASMMVMGAGYGLTNGATSEYLQEKDQIDHKKKQSFDYQRIIGMSLGSSFVTALASAPGGMQAKAAVDAKLNRLDYSDKSQPAPSRQTSCAFHNDAGYTTAHENDLLVQAHKVSDSNVPLTYPDRPFEGIGERNSRLTYKGQDYYLTGFAGKINEGEPLKNPELWGIALTSFNVKGHQTPLRVSDAYLRHLDTLTESRQNLERQGKSDAIFTHASPGDIAYLLDETPNSSLFKNVTLLGRPKTPLAADQIYPTTKGTTRYTNEMVLYRLANDADLIDTILHESYHAMENNFPELDKMQKYAVRREHGLTVSKNNPTGYAKESAAENLAELGMSLLNRNAKEFLKWVQKAPERSSIYAYALEKSLNLEKNETRLNEVQHRNRIDFIKQKAYDRILSPIEKKITNDKYLDPVEFDILKNLSPQRYEEALKKGAWKQVHELKNDWSNLDLVERFFKESKTNFETQIDYLTQMQKELGGGQKGAILLGKIDSPLANGFMIEMKFGDKHNPKWIASHANLAEAADIYLRRELAQNRTDPFNDPAVTRTLDWVKKTNFKGEARLGLLVDLTNRALISDTPVSTDAYVEILRACERAEIPTWEMRYQFRKILREGQIDESKFVNGLLASNSTEYPILRSTWLAKIATDCRASQNYEMAVTAERLRVNSLESYPTANQQILLELAQAKSDYAHCLYMSGNTSESAAQYKGVLEISSLLPPSKDTGELIKRAQKYLKQSK